MVRDLTKNESPSPHMIWSPAAFLPHFLPVPVLFTLCLPDSFLISWTHQAYSFSKPWCVGFSAWGTLFQLAMWLLSSVLQVTSPEKKIPDPSQTIHAHQPITFYSLILLYFFLYYLYSRHGIFIYLFFIHLFPLTYHSMRTEILFPLLYTEHLEQCLNHTRYSINIK